MRDKRDRSWLAAIVASVVLHAALIGYLAWMLFSPKPDPSSTPTAADIAPPAVTRDESFDMDAFIAEHVTTETQRASRMTDDAKMRRLKDLTDELAGSSVKDVTEAADAVESFMGRTAIDRAYEPKPGAKGNFDASTAVIYDIRKQAGGYEYVMVDAAGRSQPHIVSPSEMTNADLHAFTLFEMARENPTLAPLLNVARRLAAEQLDAGE